MIEKLIYSNSLNSEKDIEDFVLEGKASITFDKGAMQMSNALDSAVGQKANFVLWCPLDFPSDLRIEWDFRPLGDKGLCMMFFSAIGSSGEDIFSPNLNRREGEYFQYHNSDLNTFHASYFRRKEPDERAFHVCNLRKSKGLHLVSQGADPIPSYYEGMEFYHIRIDKFENNIKFYVNNLLLFSFIDDGVTYGPLLKGGKLGFRQLAPLKAEYKNLKVYLLS